MPTEHVPNEAQIRDAMAQLKDSGQSSYGHSVQKYARLRLFDYKDLLDEWQNPAYPLPAQAQALPNVAAAIKRPLNDEQGAKLAAYLRQQAHAGNSTAQLYLAYLHIFGRYLPASLSQAALAIRHASEAAGKIDVFAADARACRKEEWADYRIEPIALEEFMAELLIEFDQDAKLCGIAFDAELYGTEIEPVELLADLLDEIRTQNLQGEFPDFDELQRYRQEWEAMMQQPKIIH